jgi:hypothetical protein
MLMPVAYPHNRNNYIYIHTYVYINYPYFDQYVTQYNFVMIMLPRYGHMFAPSRIITRPPKIVRKPDFPLMAFRISSFLFIKGPLRKGHQHLSRAD